MKILELRLQNLNSLYGEWCIDFTHPDYHNNGIFALTGPTGAGKSTILDAICLALYGATPRLGKITKSANDLMSRHCGECYAEVVFESKAGRFRCRWEQRRARKSHHGKLQEQQHAIGDADSKQLLETKKSLVLGVIEQKTGMDFERFTRSILLAQGGFDNFLRADIEQKSKILEQITGTEIYTHISRHVHERLREEQEKWQCLQAERAAISLLQPEQEEALTLQLQSQQQRQQQLSERGQLTQQALAWLETLAELQRELAQVSEEIEALAQRQSAFQPQQAKLERAQKATTLDVQYSALSTLRQQLEDDARLEQAWQQQLPDLEAMCQQQAQQLARAEQQSAAAKQALQDAMAVFKQVRILDQQQQHLQQGITALQRQCAAEADGLQQNTQQLALSQNKLQEAQCERQRAQDYLQQHAQDAELTSALPLLASLGENITKQRQQLQALQLKAQQSQQALAQWERRLGENAQQKEAAEAALQRAHENLALAEVALQERLAGRLLREYRAEKDALLRELSLVKHIHDFAYHRRQLQAGKACPLCGSPVHPFATEGIPPTSELEQRIAAVAAIIEEVERQEQSIALCQQSVLKEKNTLDAHAQQRQLLHGQLSAERETLSSLIQRKDDCEGELAQQLERLSSKLQTFGIDSLAREPLAALQPALQQRADTWQHKQAALAQAEKQVLTTDSDRVRLQALMASQSASLADKQIQLQQLQQQHALSRQQRCALFAEQDPDEQERALQQSVLQAEQVEKALHHESRERAQQLSSLRSKLETAQQRIALGRRRLEQAEEAFQGALAQLGFAGERDFQAARLDHAARQALQAQAQALQNKHTELQAKFADRQGRLQLEGAKQITTQSLDTLQRQREQEIRQLAEVAEEIASLKHRLEQHQHAVRQLQQARQHVERQEKEYQRWQKLHLLIGSADGKKYRNFAQGLTFDLMISQANRQLRQMSDRYLLTHHPSEALVLNVIDNYQAGEIRSTKNLSGGESFIVSLSLALGLSAMASRKVSVDSLFLDEGLGTLDEEALDTALDALSRLQQRGKVIGIISHLSRLQERIATQIKVEPVGNGKSRLSGAGCG